MKTTTTTTPALLVTLFITMVSTHVSRAAVITIPTSGVTASSEIPLPFNRQDDFIVDGSGLAGGEHVNDPPDGFMWLSRGTGFGGDDLDPSVTFNLGAVYTISSFHVWNYNELAAGNNDLTGRGVNSVSVLYGITAALGSTVPGISEFARADTTSTYAGEDFSAFTPFDAQFIKFDIDSNHGCDNNFYGLSEVQFDGVVVPEPGSLALLGLGAMGLLLLRRRRAAG